MSDGLNQTTALDQATVPNKEASRRIKFDLRQPDANNRDVVLDNLRGLFLLLYIMVHFAIALVGTDRFPYALNHAYQEWSLTLPFIGYNLIDVAPIAFMFFIGAVIYPVYIRKLEKSPAPARGVSPLHTHVVKNLALNGLFLLFVIVQERAMRAINLEDYEYDGIWTFMNDVATTGLFMALFLGKPFREKTWTKFTAGFALLILYGIFREKLLWYAGTASPGLGGGIGACIGFTGIVLVTAGIFDLARKKEVYLYISVACLLALGLITLYVVGPLEKGPQNSVWSSGTTGYWSSPEASLRDDMTLAGAYTVSWMISALGFFFVFYAGFYALCHHVLKETSRYGDLR